MRQLQPPSGRSVESQPTLLQGAMPHVLSVRPICNSACGAARGQVSFADLSEPNTCKPSVLYVPHLIDADPLNHTQCNKVNERHCAICRVQTVIVAGADSSTTVHRMQLEQLCLVQIVCTVAL